MRSLALFAAGWATFCLGVLWGRKTQRDAWTLTRGIGEADDAFIERVAAQHGYKVSWHKAPAHRTYIVDLPTFQRIKEHEFLNDKSREPSDG